MMGDERRAEVEKALVAVRARVDAAASSGGRTGADVTIVVVTKTWPLEDLRVLYDVGVRDLGENRHQEAAGKAEALAGLDIRWHFIGQVQSNKAPRIAEYAATVHAVDSVRVARRLDAGAARARRLVDCFVQVSLDPGQPTSGRGGASPETVPEIAEAIATSQQLRLVGVMGVAPLRADVAPAYERLCAVSRALIVGHPEATAISAGMSDDFEAAVKAGATHVRVGTAVLGRRPSSG